MESDEATPDDGERLRAVRHVVLDMDGTIYLGGRLFAETVPFLAVLAELGIGWDFLTNNNSRSRAEYVEKLAGMGIEVEAGQVMLSTDACVATLRGEFPGVRRVFVLGAAGLKADLGNAGFEVVDEGACDAVVVGFDTTLGYERLSRAAFLIGEGKPYVATHPDRVCPTDEATVLPDCGAICALLESATGRKPDVVSGKPNPAMLEAVIEKRGLVAEEVMMVGDRIYTDMRMAREAGVLGVLTLTGEATREQASEAPAGPDWIIDDLGELAALLRSSRK
ncbi:MAG: HAD-IIA family hydrolase [Verrucomicrobiales bacterium]|nr:HAD-IIA family hydrolase [Verrucomicrobiales bacterium]